MKDWTEKIVFAFYGMFGAAVGLLVFMFALDGWGYVFTGRATKSWNGGMALTICCLIGGGWGLAAYKWKEVEAGSQGSSFYDSPAGAILFSKRVMVIATCVIAAYFLWQLAKGI